MKGKVVGRYVVCSVNEGVNTISFKFKGAKAEEADSQARKCVFSEYRCSEVVIVFGDEAVKESDCGITFSFKSEFDIWMLLTEVCQKGMGMF